MEATPNVQQIPLLLMTADQASRALAISQRKLWELTKVGEIRRVNIGRSVRYRPSDLQTWIDAQQTTDDPVTGDQPDPEV